MCAKGPCNGLVYAQSWEGKFDEEGLPHGPGKMAYPPKPVGEDGEL
jgi:hypothetical protein